MLKISFKIACQGSWLYLAIILVLLKVEVSFAQSVGIRDNVEFQWSDTQINLSDPATINYITIDGIEFNTFVVPSTYELTRMGLGGHFSNDIWRNGTKLLGTSDNPSWDEQALLAYQSINLNHYFQATDTGNDFCGDFAAAATNTSQIQTIRYDPAIPSNPDGIIAVTERGGNNCLYIEVYGIPWRGESEVLLGRTFARPGDELIGQGPQTPPTLNSDYWNSGRVNENNQAIGIALFNLSDIAPIGSRITAIRYIGATSGSADGKFFLMQTYAVDDIFDADFGLQYDGNVTLNDNAPLNTTYVLESEPGNGRVVMNIDGSFSYIPNPAFIGDDTFLVNVCLPAPNESVCNIATVTIRVRPGPAELTIDNSSALEGDDLVFTITNNNPLSRPIEINLDYVNINASDADYNAPVSVILPANQTSVSFTITTVDDILIERTEAFDIRMTTTDSYVLSDDMGTGNIVDNDGRPGTGIYFTNTNVVVTEGIDDFALFNIILIGEITENVSVDYSSSENSALEQEDFTTVSGTLTFTPDQKSFIIQVPISDDLVIETEESFLLSLSTITSNIGIGFVDGNDTNSAIGTIVDNDMHEIMVEVYREEINLMCGDPIPYVPTLLYTGGCGDNVVNLTEITEDVIGTKDYFIIRTWDVRDACGNTASFSQSIFIFQAEREEINITICIDNDAIDLLDYLPESYNTNGSFTVVRGDLVLEDSVFQPSEVKEGQYLITYEYGDASCIFYADFIITVNADCLPCDINDMVVSKTITINGDGINDYFNITGLENCGYTYRVDMYNRWGAKVFESHDYQNDWGGSSPAGSFGSSDVLPSGTYYYMISLSDPQLTRRSGYIYIGSN